MKVTLIIIVTAFNNFGTSVKVDQVPFKSMEACQVAASTVLEMNYFNQNSRHVFTMARCVEDK